MEIKKNKREKYIDHTKAFAIILVVIGHVALRVTKDTHDIWGVLSYYIYCFHMPLFFILSGMSYAISLRTNSERRTVRYLIMHCFDFGWSVLLFNGLYFGLLSSRFLEIFRDRGFVGILLTGAVRYWYIVVLCLIYIVVFCIKRINIYTSLAILTTSFLCGIVHMGTAKFFFYLALFLLGVCLYDKTIAIHGGGYFRPDICAA